MSFLKIPFFKKKSVALPGDNEDNITSSHNSMMERWNTKWSNKSGKAHWAIQDIPESIQNIFNKFEIPINFTIIDIGCGDGKLSNLLANKGFQITGIDISDVGIAKAINENNHPNVKFKQCDITMPLSDIGVYDLAIDRGALHTIPKRLHPDYKNNIAKLIKPNGLFILQYALRKNKNINNENLDIYLDNLFNSSFEKVSMEEVIMSTNIKRGEIKGLNILYRRK